MKINVRFLENKQTFNTGMGEMTVLHDGQNGATFTPSVSADGILSWTNDRELPNPEPVNIKGADGRDGAKGDTGPQGAKGDTGPQGPKGDKGDTGAQGPAGADGKNGTDGKNGQNGYTPVKGTDYFTAADKADMVAAVIAALPVYGGETA